MRAAARRGEGELGAQVWVVSEYGHCDVTRPVYPNRALRNAGLLEVRRGPFGEQLDLYGSGRSPSCDHSSPTSTSTTRRIVPRRARHAR